jgi:hypothetical protein
LVLLGRDVVVACVVELFIRGALMNRFVHHYSSCSQELTESLTVLHGYNSRLPLRCALMAL